MAYCPRCGTANPEPTTRCPLCATPIPVLEDEPSGPPAWPSPMEDRTAPLWKTPPQKRRSAFLVVSFFLLFPAALVTGIDLLVAVEVTWSWIPDLVLVGLWSLVLGFFVWYRSPLRLLGFSATVAAAVVVLANQLSSGRLDWSLTAGLPLIFWSLAVASALTLWLRVARRPGWNLFGHLGLGLSVFCGGAEWILRFSGLVGPGLWWSAIVALVLVPLGLFFEVLHYGLGRRLNLRQSFHF